MDFLDEPAAERARADLPLAGSVLIVDGRARSSARWPALSGLQYKVTVVSSFECARRSLRDAPSDVLVTDLTLGRFNGLHLVILAKASNPACVGIVCSPFDSASLSSDASSLGAHYLYLPHRGALDLWSAWMGDAMSPAGRTSQMSRPRVAASAGGGRSGARLAGAVLPSE